MKVNCTSFRVDRDQNGGLTISGEGSSGGASMYFPPERVPMLLDALGPPPRISPVEDVNSEVAGAYDWIAERRDAGESWGTIGKEWGWSGWRVQKAFERQSKVRAGTLRPAGRPKTKKNKKEGLK